MGRDNNVKETFSIIKGWEVLKEDSIYTQKTMDIIVENLSGDARTILVEKGGKKLKLPVLFYDEEKFIKTPYHAEHKERWATRLVRHGSVGMGYKEVLE